MDFPTHDEARVCSVCIRARGAFELDNQQPHFCSLESLLTDYTELISSIDRVTDAVSVRRRLPTYTPVGSVSHRSPGLSSVLSRYRLQRPMAVGSWEMVSAGALHMIDAVCRCRDNKRQTRGGVDLQPHKDGQQRYLSQSHPHTSSSNIQESRTC